LEGRSLSGTLGEECPIKQRKIYVQISLDLRRGEWYEVFPI
jgi:hypothetical protein